MGLAIPTDRTPTSDRAIEARWFALDPRIKDKLAQLEAEKDSRHGALEALGWRLHARRDELARLQRLLARDEADARPAGFTVVQGAPINGGGVGAGVAPFGGPVPPERQQEIARVAEEVDRLDGHYRSAEQRWQLAARISQECRAWLAATPIVVPVEVPCERVADPRVELAAIREQLGALATEALAAASAPVPLAEALARLDEQRNRVAARVAARRASCAAAFFSVRGVPDVAALGFAHDFGSAPREIEQAWRDVADETFLATAAEWEKAIRAHRVNGKAVGSAERPKRLAELARKRADLEQREETILLAAEHDGLDALDRRADASPAVVVCTVLAAEDATA